jgi:hypothetical protein
VGGEQHRATFAAAPATSPPSTCRYWAWASQRSFGRDGPDRHNAFAGAPPGTDAVWTGAVSSSWTTAANWAPGVPGLTDDVFIRADAVNPLVVTGVRTVDSLTVQTGAIVTVSGAADTLVVGGSLAAGSPAIGGTGAVR